MFPCCRTSSAFHASVTNAGGTQVSNPLAAGFPDQAEGLEDEEEGQGLQIRAGQGPLQNASMEVMPYQGNTLGSYQNPGQGWQPDFGLQQSPAWQYGQQPGLVQGQNPRGLLALPAPERSGISAQESEVQLEFGLSTRAGIGQYSMEHSFSAAYVAPQGTAMQPYSQQQQLQKQIQDQSQPWQQSNNAVQPAVQLGTSAYAQDQKAMYQLRLQQQKLQQQKQQQQPPAEHELALIANQAYSWGDPSPSQPQQQMQLQQQPRPAAQVGSLNFAQSQAAAYQQKLQQLKQRQLQQQQQQQQLQMPAQSDYGQPSQAALQTQPMQQLQEQYQQQLPQQGAVPWQGQLMGASTNPSPDNPPVASGNNSSNASFSGMQTGPLRAASPLPNSQMENSGLNSQLGRAQMGGNGPNGQMDSAQIGGNGPTSQMGSVGFALAQNANYQQRLQQQQLRSQQRRNSLVSQQAPAAAQPVQPQVVPAQPQAASRGGVTPEVSLAVATAHEVPKL